MTTHLILPNRNSEHDHCSIFQPSPLTLPAVLALALLTLGGCDKKAESTPASQVAAKVNDAEITVHQVNQVLAKAGNVPPAQQDQVRKNVLDNLVNQQLLAAKAVENKLDRTPETLMAIEAAKREILARAYMETIVAAVLATAHRARWFAFPSVPLSEESSPEVVRSRCLTPARAAEASVRKARSEFGDRPSRPFAPSVARAEANSRRGLRKGTQQ